MLQRRRAKLREENEGRDIDLEAVERKDMAEQLADSLTGAVSGHPVVPTVVVIDDAHAADANVVHLVRQILGRRHRC